MRTSLLLIAWIVAGAYGVAAVPAPSAAAKASTAGAPSSAAVQRQKAPPPVPVMPPPEGFAYISTAIENASPLHWDVDASGAVVVSLHYDHERASPNRAAGHWHFRVEGRPGATITLVLQNFHNVWNGRYGAVVDARTTCVVSEDGRRWTPMRMELIEGTRVRFSVTLPASGSLAVARLEPYRLSDLERWLEGLKERRDVRVESIGRTYEGRPLEIVCVGREEAPHRVFVRARSHPWEPGGNWVLQGLVRAQLADTSEGRRLRDRVCLWLLPMANKDGVARGLTRFNLAGMDLNRGWDKPAPQAYSPENYALERWLEAMTARGLRPHFALDLHNDAGGRLHIARPEVPGLAAYLEGMKRFEALLRRHTWFREGATNAGFRNPGSLGDGWLERFGIPAAVLELNANWSAGKERIPMGADWEEYGEGLARVFADFFE